MVTNLPAASPGVRSGGVRLTQNKLRPVAAKVSAGAEFTKCNLCLAGTAKFYFVVVFQLFLMYSCNSNNRIFSTVNACLLQNQIQYYQLIVRRFSIQQQIP